MISMFLAVLRGFLYAFRGIVCTLREERNFRIHLVAVFFVTWFSFLYEVTAGQALVLLLCCSAVLSLELLNTAVENAVDLSTAEICPLAKKAKDAAAGAVFVSAVGSVIAAVIMFRDPLHWSFLWEKIISPVRMVCFVLFAVLALFFIKGHNKPEND